MEDKEFEAKKQAILDKIFISSEEAERYKKKIKQMKNLELTQLVSQQRNLIMKIPDLLGEILRRRDLKGAEAELFQDIFQDFCNAIDKFGIRHKKSKILQRIHSYKSKIKSLENQLQESEEKRTHSHHPDGSVADKGKLNGRIGASLPLETSGGANSQFGDTQSTDKKIGKHMDDAFPDKEEEK